MSNIVGQKAKKWGRGTGINTLPKHFENFEDFLELDCPRVQIRPAILQNPGMDTFRPTEPLSPGMDTLILLWDIKIGQNVLLWENQPTILSMLADT